MEVLISFTNLLDKVSKMVEIDNVIVFHEIATTIMEENTVIVKITIVR